MGSGIVIVLFDRIEPDSLKVLRAIVGSYFDGDVRVGLIRNLCRILGTRMCCNA